MYFSDLLVLNMVLREMEKKNMVDVACFFLFEASGDSEGGLDPLLPEMGCSVSSDMDAESCCDDDDSETGYGDDGGEKGEFEERESEDEMNNHCQRWCPEEEEEEEVETEKKPNTKTSVSGCLNRDNEFLNEMEKNKLFWEACLAS